MPTETPNVIWKDARAAYPSVSAGPLTVDLPDEATQRAGFYHASARVLCDGVKGFKKLLNGKAKKDGEAT